MSFAGVIPGGFQGQRGYLFSLILESGSRQDTIIRFDNTQALLNDGSGTPAAVRESPLELRVREGAVVQRYELAPDFEPPESFGIEIARDPSIFDGRWFIVFAAHDKLSGLGSYEVWEQPPRWSLKGMLKGEEWVRGQSPYVLTDQTRRSTVLVRATDRAGNRRVERLSPSNNQAWFRQSPLLTALLLGVFAVTVMAGLLWRRKFK
ncbi:hypothetical protein HY628_02475 [Candidatus Uhrbacteria bacterium]|nr:hypothetical protein [Candidatus Uhrbacteria bacterium]